MLTHSCLTNHSHTTEQYHYYEVANDLNGYNIQNMRLKSRSSLRSLISQQTSAFQIMSSVTEAICRRTSGMDKNVLWDIANF